MISSVDWNYLWELCYDIDDFVELFTLTTLQICEICCPKKIASKKKPNRCLNALNRKRRKIQAQLGKVKDNPRSPVSQITALENKLSLIHVDIRDAINSDLLFKERQAVSKVKSNPKYFYSYAKQFTKKKQNISMLFDELGQIKSSPKELADLLQKQFTSVFSDPSKSDLNAASFEPPTIREPFTDEKLEFTIDDIIEAIEEMRQNSAPGPDEISALLLQKCKTSLAIPIHLIWLHSMDECNVPNFYKLSHIFPLHKKDSKSLPANYRPVSLTSHVVKVFERVIRKKIVHHLEANDIICSMQHGFRSGRSCLTQLLHHLDDALNSLTDNHDFDSIYLDYAKAFDKVDHKILLKKLEVCGINSKLINWIRSFLTNRMQGVVINGQISVLALIISGVPQGTVLGPILFLIFINDISHCISDSIIRCFADDTRVSRSIRCEEDVALLQLDLHKVIQWSETNNMSLHKDKFEYMSYQHNRQNTLTELPSICEQFQYWVSDTSLLRPVLQLRDLGVTLTSDLSWTPFILEITSKARQKAAWVLSVFHSRSPDIMLALYKSMVRSLLEYCCPLWNPTKVADIQELENVQKVFTRKILGMSDLNYWERLEKLSLFSLQRRRERYIILHMWKILNSATSNDLNIEFYFRPRLGNLAKIPPCKKNSSKFHWSTYERSFAVMGPKLWNCIPYNINSIQNMDIFKLRLNEFLKSVPDTPPVRGYSPSNSNSLLCWRKDKEASASWSGHTRRLY